MNELQPELIPGEPITAFNTMKCTCRDGVELQSAIKKSNNYPLVALVDK